MLLAAALRRGSSGWRLSRQGFPWNLSNGYPVFPSEVHVMKAGLLIFAALALGMSALAQESEKMFVSGGKIDIQLESGGYDIKPSADNKIHIACSGPRSEQAKISINTNGNHADLRISNTPNNNFHAMIEIPGASDLTIHMTAGELRITEIAGNKDLTLRAGNLDVKITDPAEYARVEASVNAGDLNTPAFGGSTGGLFRSFKWSGKGKYILRAHLMTGELNLWK
jgi:hypothetical protein